MAKLNQIIAIEKGIKSKSYAEITQLDKAAKKPDLFNGFSKTYQAKDDEGETLPSEKKRVQYSVEEVMRATERAMVELINITSRKDFTNTVAKADVMLNGKTIVKGAPVSFLLFLEKQMNDLRTFAADLPVLDENEDWKKDSHSGLYKSGVTQTHRTKKVQKPIVMYQATVEHPAQTAMIVEDVIAGYWSSEKHSGAMPLPEKQKLVARIDALSNAIKQARETANMEDEVTVDDVGLAIFDYLKGD
jgi:hypothetical protein